MEKRVLEFLFVFQILSHGGKENTPQRKEDNDVNHEGRKSLTAITRSIYDGPPQLGVCEMVSLSMCNQ